MPGRLEYDEAMLFSAIRLKVSDLDLKQGKVEMLSAQTAQGTMDRPWGIEGGFAVVYKFRRKSGALCALRCFRVPTKPDTQFRYERIGPYFLTHAPAITANFHYYDAAIMVKEQGKAQNQTFPIIEMDWIEGANLVDKVDELCRKRERVALKRLAEQWLALINTMRQAHIAHGDLAGVNVMVRDDGRLVLIDYDGIYIPEFAGLDPILVGQEDFQHPQMNQRGFHEHIDAFSALVIYIALAALAIKPELWDKYAKFNAKRELVDFNMLFRKQDFQNPQQSPLFQDLERLGDAYVRDLMHEMRRLCLLPINDVKFPFVLVDPLYHQKQALTHLDSAVQANDDEQIVASWLPIVEQYPPAQQYRARVQLAQQRIAALLPFRAALASGNLQRIQDSYDTIQIDVSSSISSEERLLLALARDFLQACTDDNEDAVDIADTIARDVQGIHVVFTAQQQRLLNQIRQRRHARQAIAQAFQSRDLTEIAATYSFLQYATAVERLRIEEAKAFTLAYNAGDDQSLLAAYTILRQDADPNFFSLTADQHRRITQIQKHDEVLQQFREALTSRSPWRVVQTYEAVLDSSTRVTALEREQLALARTLTEALRSSNLSQILAAENALQQSPHSTFFLLTPEEKEQFDFAREQNKAVLAFRAALQSKRPDEIVAAHSPLLDAGQALQSDELEQLALARGFLRAWNEDDDEALASIHQRLQRPVARNFFRFTPQEHQRFDLARQRIEAVDELRQVLRSMPEQAQDILDAYDASLLDSSSLLRANEREMVKAAQQYTMMYTAVQIGLQANDDDRIRHAFDPVLAQRFTDLTQAEMQRIERAMVTQELENLLDSEAYEQAFQLAFSQQAQGYGISSSLIFKLKRATLRFIRNYDLYGLTVRIDEYNNVHYATVSWQWPAHPLIKAGLLAWHTRTWPERPSEQRLNDPNWPYISVRKQNNVLYDSRTFSIGNETHIYVRGFVAFLDEWDHDKKWRFSEGRHPTSYAEAMGSQVMR